MGRLSINLLGTLFSINASEDDAYLESLLDNYTQVVNKIQSNGMRLNDLQVAILAGIMVTDDLFRERAKKTEHKNNTASDDEAEKHTIEMIKKLEQALNAK